MRWPSALTAGFGRGDRDRGVLAGHGGDLQPGGAVDEFLTAPGTQPDRAPVPVVTVQMRKDDGGDRRLLLD